MAEATETVKRATILFADIVGSVEVSDSTDLKTYDEFLSEYGRIADMAFEAIIGRDVVQQDAEIEVRGDEVCLKLHSGPKDEPSADYDTTESDHKASAERDVGLALRYAHCLKALWYRTPHNCERFRQYKRPRELAVGIGHGPVAVHGDGSAVWSEGFAINIAKRIEGAARLGTYSHILVSQRVGAIAREAGEHFGFGAHHDVELKGLNRAERLLEVTSVKGNLFKEHPQVVRHSYNQQTARALRQLLASVAADQTSPWFREMIAAILLSYGHRMYAKQVLQDFHREGVGFEEIAAALEAGC